MPQFYHPFSRFFPRHIAFIRSGDLGIVRPCFEFLVSGRIVVFPPNGVSAVEEAAALRRDAPTPSSWNKTPPCLLVDPDSYADIGAVSFDTVAT